MENPTPLHTPEPVQRASRFLFPAGVAFLLLLVAVVGAYAWYSLNSSCDVNSVRQASAVLLSQMKVYDKEYQFVVTADRASLVRPVGVLQQIYQDTKEVAVPACMQTAKDELMSYMETVIRAFLAFIAQEADGTVSDLIDQSEEHYDNFAAELEAVNECAPLCIPYLNKGE